MQASMHQIYKQFDKNVEPYLLFQLVVLVVCLFVLDVLVKQKGWRQNQRCQRLIINTFEE